MPCPDPFTFGMLAVKVAQDALTAHIGVGTLLSIAPVKQIKADELRYSRYSDFDDAVVEACLQALPKSVAAFTNARRACVVESGIRIGLNASERLRPHAGWRRGSSEGNSIG